MNMLTVMMEKSTSMSIHTPTLMSTVMMARDMTMYMNMSMSMTTITSMIIITTIMVPWRTRSR
jgi:hypothetical protein